MLLTTAFCLTFTELHSQCNPFTPYCEEQAAFSIEVDVDCTDGSINVTVQSLLPQYNNYNHSYSLINETTGITIQSFNGKDGVFTNIDPTIPYRICHCLSNSTNNYLCCRGLSGIYIINNCDGGPECCILTYRLLALGETAPINWNFGDGSTTSGGNIEDHEYINVNTQQTPSAVVTAGALTRTVNFPSNSIFVGAYNSCDTTANLTAIPNSVNTAFNIFPGASVTGMDIAMNGEVLATSVNYTFNNCDICMNWGASVRANNTTLKFSDTDVHGNCDGMPWDGIKFVSPTGSGSGTFIAYNSTFHDALHPVYSEDATIRLNIQQSQFMQNYMGICIIEPAHPRETEITGNQFGQPAGQLGIPKPTMFQCNMQAPVTGIPVLAEPLAGVWVTQLQTQAIPGIVVPLHGTSGSENTFSNLAFGVFTANVSTEVSGARFENLRVLAYDNPTAGIEGGTGIRFLTSINGTRLDYQGDQTGDVFNCHIGVEADVLGGTNSWVRVRKADMDAVDFGIRLANGTAGRLGIATELSGNLIDHLITGIELVLNNVLSGASNTTTLIEDNQISTETGNFGILLVNASGSNNMVDVDVITNTVTGGVDGIQLQNFSHGNLNSNVVTGFQQTGISLLGGSENFVDCNKSTSTSVAVASILTNISSDNQYRFNGTDGSQSGIEFRGINNTGGMSNAVVAFNDIGSHARGLFYATNDASTGPQINRGNQWNGTYGNVVATEGAAVHFGNSAFVLGGSLYRTGNICSQLPTSFYVDPLLAITDWFLGGMNVDCSLKCGVNFTGEGGEGEFAQSVAKGSFDPGGEGTYSAQKAVYGMLLNEPEMLNFPILADWKAAHEADPYGILSTAERNIAQAGQLSEEQVHEWNSATQALNHAIFVLDSLQNESPDHADLETWRQYATSANVTIQGFEALQMEVLANTATSVLNQVISVDGSEVWIENDKTVNKLVLESLMLDAQPTDAQLNEAYAVAIQCPDEGGSAVFKARALYYAFTGIHIDNECGTAQRELKNKKGMGNMPGFAALLAPNPTKDKLRLEFKYPLENKVVVSILSTAGVVMQRQEISAIGQMEVVLLLKDLPAGMYVCRIEPDFIAPIFHNFVVIH